jgi:shikimate kinase
LPITNLLLFGFKNSGKTYWGKRLADELNYCFIDTDHLVEELYTKASSRLLNCSEIYKEVGESGFRKLEREAIGTLEGVANLSIIALGGGAIVDPKNLQRFKQMGRLVYLKVNKEILKQRLLGSAPPAFLDKSDLGNSFEALYNARIALYEAIPAHQIELTGVTDTEILNKFKKIAYGE